MQSITRKAVVRIDRALSRFFKEPTFFSQNEMTVQDWGESLGHEIRLSDGRRLIPNTLGRELLRTIVAEVHEGGTFQGLADFSDIWTALRAVLQDCLAAGGRPSNGSELLSLLREKVEAEIRERTFVVSLYGVGLKGISSVPLGSLSLMAPDAPFIEARGLNDENGLLALWMRDTAELLWLVGSFRGTARTAQRRFDVQARLAAGWLAISAASIYRRGAAKFRIGPLLSAEEGLGRCPSLFWDGKSKNLGYSLRFQRSQNFEIDASLLEQFRGSGVFEDALSILQKEEQTEVESAISKAVFWYADAHRDSLEVMRFVKYWSCVEAFFSLDKEALTQHIAIGTVAVLTFGEFEFLLADEYELNKKKVKKLYGYRSSAVHRAAHDHVSQADVDELSQWVSWLVISMVSLAGRYKTLRGILQHSLEIDRKHPARDSSDA